MEAPVYLSSPPNPFANKESRRYAQPVSRRGRIGESAAESSQRLMRPTALNHSPPHTLAPIAIRPEPGRVISPPRSDLARAVNTGTRGKQPLPSKNASIAEFAKAVNDRASEQIAPRSGRKSSADSKKAMKGRAGKQDEHRILGPPLIDFARAVNRTIENQAASSGMDPSQKGDRKVQCESCPRTFATAQHLDQHREFSHTVYACDLPQCKRIFSSANVLAQHRKKHHPRQK